MFHPNALSALLAFLAAVGWAAACYYVTRLRIIAARARRAHIVVGYKNKPVLYAPISEWLMWAHRLDDNKASKGQVVYRGGHVSVSVLRELERATEARVVKQT